MLSLNAINLVITSFLMIIIIVCSIGIIIAIKFQSKQRRKYEKCINIIKDKENIPLLVKTGMSKEEINNINPQINVNELMKKLYEIYLQLEDKIRRNDNDFENILTGQMKDFYISKIEGLKLKKCFEINEGIELINYSIIDFSENKLKFRITINCLSYKMSNEKIISGSNIDKIQKILIITYENINNNWLISNYENVYEKKLSN